MSILNFLMAAPAGADGQQGSNPIVMGVAVVLMIAIFYFFLIRPQKKQEKEAKKMLSELKKGDKIVTIGGIHGVVFAVKEATVVVKVDDGAKIEFTKSAIAKVVNDAPAAVEEKPAKTEKKAKAAKEEEKAEETAEKPAKKAAKTSTAKKAKK